MLQLPKSASMVHVDEEVCHFKSSVAPFVAQGLDFRFIRWQTRSTAEVSADLASASLALDHVDNLDRITHSEACNKPPQHREHRPLALQYPEALQLFSALML